MVKVGGVWVGALFRNHLVWKEIKLLKRGCFQGLG